ncbi:hypothetical protein HU200_053868 [Digitaria exilis]|uniref:Uncharacterized protein n=1 Tax=Digitaria exilis TaxID=1010633 RepID=A0A835E646_9POAL|nr:hypothetical protein HU200_053868 [Digitaria exilis]
MSANYQPSSWDYDALLSLDSGNLKQVYPSEYYKLKRSITDMLLKKAESASKLYTIDAMQRLGISYHFEEEISDILNSVSKEKAKEQHADGDLASAALKFRLLRENGFPTTPGINHNVAGPLSYHNYRKCSIKTAGQEDVNALLSLYEASNLAFPDEELLDEARIFSAEALKELMPSMPPHLSEGVAHALELPLHWRAPRLETRWFINQYSRDIDMCPLLLQFAKLDFNKVQDEHQQDLATVTRWWRNIAFGKKLTFARDRLMECFHYANGIVWEPKLGPCRQMLTKVSSLIVHLDDVYDVYGTMDELVLLTEAIARVGCRPSEALPDYMKAVYYAIYNTTNELADHSLREHGCRMHHLLQKSWHDLCMAFMMEAKWYQGKYRPRLQDYLENGRISPSAPLLLLHAFPMLSSVVNMKTLDQIQTNPRLVHSASLILRLCNDSATHTDELKRGDAPSSIGIHMFENGANEQDSRTAMQDLILEAWNTVNEEAFDNCQLSVPFKKACVNLARISYCIYQDGDGIGAPNGLKKKQIKELFLEPIDEMNHH